MTLKLLPQQSRPREKLLARGASSLSDEELLAIFLRTGIKGMNAICLADKLLKSFGSLSKLLSATEQEFCAHKGLGPAKYVQLQAVLEMNRRYLLETIQRENALTRSQQTKEYLLSILKGRRRELFYVLFLDNQHRVIKGEGMFEGTIDEASVYPREVLARAIELQAAAVILAHNHPSGVAEASASDRHITRKLETVLDLVNIRVLDHIIVGDGDVLSFSERGWIGP